MQYLLLITNDESNDQALSPAEAEERMGRYAKWVEEANARGVLRGGERLRPTSDATTVRVREGDTVTVDGPFAETKEQIGGYFVIEVDDLDQAVAAAAMLPAAETGAIEVRPIWSM